MPRWIDSFVRRLLATASAFSSAFTHTHFRYCSHFKHAAPFKCFSLETRSFRNGTDIAKSRSSCEVTEHNATDAAFKLEQRNNATSPTPLRGQADRDIGSICADLRATGADNDRILAATIPDKARHYHLSTICPIRDFHREIDVASNKKK